MKGLIVLAALCCSSSFAVPVLKGLLSGSDSGGFMGGFMSGITNPVGGATDVFNLATKGTGHTMKEAPVGALCENICGNCSPAKFQELGKSPHIASAADAEAICKGNRSGFSGPQAHWDNFTKKVGTNCCK